eukprot:5857924-Pyramimonas_sp.AAC.1
MERRHLRDTHGAFHCFAAELNLPAPSFAPQIPKWPRTAGSSTSPRPRRTGGPKVHTQDAPRHHPASDAYH